MVQAVLVFSAGIGMMFGIGKCAMLVMYKGQIVKIVGIELPDDRVFNSFQEGESYISLGRLKAERFLEKELKMKVSN